jgi:hypothetical protein
LPILSHVCISEIFNKRILTFLSVYKHLNVQVKSQKVRLCMFIIYHVLDKCEDCENQESVSSLSSFSMNFFSIAHLPPCPAPLSSPSFHLLETHTTREDGARSAGPKRKKGGGAMASIELRRRLGRCGLRGASVGEQVSQFSYR